MSLRGASAGNTLILVDGIPVNDPSVITNYFDLNLLTPDQVDHIEVMKGGQSTLYGSDAVAGVINIILKKNRQPGFSGDLALNAGSYGTLEQSAGIRAANKQIGFSLAYRHNQSRGFSSAYDPSKSGSFDRDGFNQHGVDGKLDLRLHPRLLLQLSGQYAYYRAELDAAAYTDEKDYAVRNRNLRVAAGLSWEHGHGTLRANYHYNRVNRHYVDDSVFRGSPYLDYSDTRFTGRTHFAEVYNQWKGKNWEWIAGMDLRSHFTDQYALFIFPGFPTPPSTLKARMSQWSPYSSLLLRAGRGWAFEFGGRWNHHSEYGNNFSFTLNPSWQAGRRVKLFGNLYSAYKVPTLYQLFDPSAGNKNLKPEEGVVAELGTVLTPAAAQRIRLTGFYRKTRHAILYSFDPSTYQSLYVNAASQQNYGLEAEADYRFGKWSLRVNYTYTDGATRSAYDGTGAPLGKDTSYFNLYRIPRHAGNLALSWSPVKTIWLETRLRLVSKRQEFIYGASPEVQGGYGVVDLYGEYRFGRPLVVFLNLRNLTNTRYFDIPGYTSRNFNLLAGISVKF